MKVFLIAALILGVVLSAEQSRNPGQLLVDHINALILSIRNEQTAHDDIFAIQKRECDDELGFRRKEVSDAADALTRATEHRGRCSASYASANADLVKTRAYQQTMNDQLSFIANRRTDEAATFQKKVTNIQNSLNLIEQAEEIVGQFANAQSSFLQVTKHFNKLFVQGTKAGIASDLSPMLAILVELGEKQNGNVTVDQIARIRGLLASLREKLQDSVALLTDNENSSIADYLARKERVEAVVALLEATQGRLSAYIAQMQACITKEDDIINSATSKKVRNQNILNFATDMCNSFDQEYNDATAARYLKHLTFLDAEKSSSSENSELSSSKELMNSQPTEVTLMMSSPPTHNQDPKLLKRLNSCNCVPTLDKEKSEYELCSTIKNYIITIHNNFIWINQS